MKKWIILVVLLAALGAGAYYYFQVYRPQQAAAAMSNLQTVKAEKGELVATIGATGQVRSKQTVLLGWKTTGTVGAVNVQVGDHVKAGQKLAEISETSLPQTVILARADLVNAKKAQEDLYTNAQNAAVQALQAISTSAQALKAAQYQLDNYIMPTYLQGLSSIEAVDKMQKALDEARAAFEPVKYYPENDETRKDLKEKLDQAQSDYNAAVKRLDYEYSMQVAQSNLDKARKDYATYAAGPSQDDIAAIQARVAAAEATLNTSFIEAPFDGVITLVDVKPGDQASLTAGTPAFRLDDMSALLVDVSVSEVDINQIKPGQDVTLTFDAIRNKEYKGKVATVDRVGTSVQGAVEFVVTVELIEPDDQVKPGMTAAVNIVTTRLQEVLLVPNRAVRFSDGQQVVFVLKDGQMVKTNISLGASSESNSEVTGGDLQVGDEVILNPPAIFSNDGPPPFVRRGQ
jgi:HlyD family secretion protein